MDIWGFVLGGAAVAAVIKLMESIIMHCLKQRSNKIDYQEEELIALASGLKAMLRDRLRHLGKGYLEEGCIGFEEREDLIDMHESYKALGGNGNLSALIKQVMKLPIKYK